MIRALFLQTSNSGVAWYRLTSWSSAAHRTKAFNALQPWWDKSMTATHPWELDLEDTVLRRRLLGELDDHAKTANVVICQMVHTRAALTVLEGFKAMYKIPLITEIDDNMLATPTYNPASAVYGQGSVFRALALEQFRLSDAMIVSTPHLKEVYADYCKNIYVMPNSLDFRIWDNLRHKRNTDVIRIGWMGGASHEGDLKIIEPVVHRLLAKHPTIRFCFVHGIPPFLRGIDRVEEVHEFTRIDRYPQFLAGKGFDIGLAPLVDSSFNRSKSNLRWLEYAGLRVPCVASAVGNFNETITQAHDGLLCETQKDWEDSLSWLISDEVARKKIGKNANKTARNRFNMDINVFLYRDALEEVVGRGVVVEAPKQEATVS